MPSVALTYCYLIFNFSPSYHPGTKFSHDLYLSKAQTAMKNPMFTVFL